MTSSRERFERWAFDNGLFPGKEGDELHTSHTMKWCWKAWQAAVPKDYAVVPCSPTQEMVDAADAAHMPFGDMELAIRLAIIAGDKAT